MTILNTSPFSMGALSRSLSKLRVDTQYSFYVHDLRQAVPSNMLLSFKGVATADHKVGFMTIERSIEIRDGDIIVLRTNDGKDIAHYVFDVSRNMFKCDKYEAYSVVFPGSLPGFGLRGQCREDDLNGRGSSAETAPRRAALSA